MADDTVEKARHTLDAAALAYNIASTEWEHYPALKRAYEDAIDALIAAVRAEEAHYLKAMGNEVEILRTEVVKLTATIQQHLRP